MIFGKSKGDCVTEHTHWQNAPSQTTPSMNRLVIGLTGGIGSGKSLASDWFAKQGIEVVDADVISHQVVAKGTPTLVKIQQQFGDWVLDKNNELNRQALRQFVFNDANALMALEAITHPVIRQQAEQQLAAAQSEYVILSAPLLFEAHKAGLVGLCQRVLVIDAPKTLQLSRASNRDGQSVEKIKAVMQHQLSRTERLARADDVAVNDGSPSDLYQQLQTFHQQYLQLAQNKS